VVPRCGFRRKRLEQVADQGGPDQVAQPRVERDDQVQAAEDFGPAALVDVDELPGAGLIMPCGGVGAPLVGLEKIEAGR